MAFESKIPEGPIAAPRFDALAAVPGVQRPAALSNPSQQFLRLAKRDQVFVEVHRNEIALTRIAMLVDFAFKQASEFRGQPVFGRRGRLLQI